MLYHGPRRLSLYFSPAKAAQPFGQHTAAHPICESHRFRCNIPVVPNGKTSALVGGPLAALALWLALRFGLQLEVAVCWTAAITCLCAIWLVFQPIPIPATSIIPFALFPLVGVLTHEQVATRYGHPIILLFMGGFMLSGAMEKSGAHRRVALGLGRMVGGGGGRWLVLGFMIASAALSMWITNTATTLMLLPIALAVLEQADDEDLAVPLLLGIAYAASIGGLGTPIGSPPNAYFMGYYDQALGDHVRNTGEQLGAPWTFAQWMMIGLPVVLVLLPLAWLWLTRNLRKASRIELPDCGPRTKAETRVMIVLVLTALLWTTRRGPFGGWGGFLQQLWGGQNEVLVGDSTVALFMVLVMFIVSDGKGGRLLDWQTAVKIPWGILLLIGGGLVIGSAFQESGLAGVMGRSLEGVQALPVWLMIGVICLCVTFLTEITSNLATTVVLMPVLFEAGKVAQLDPALLMAPAAVSASCAFMLPVATPPNAIVFGSDRLTIPTMVREGLVLNLVGVVVITTVCYLVLS